MEFLELIFINYYENVKIKMLIWCKGSLVTY